MKATLHCGMLRMISRSSSAMSNPSGTSKADWFCARYISSGARHI
jgi:hypothetical protein